VGELPELLVEQQQADLLVVVVQGFSMAVLN